MGMLQTLFGSRTPAVPIVSDDDVRAYIARRAVLARTVSAPFAFHPSIQYSGIGSKQPTAALLLQEALGWFDIGVRTVANRVASLDLEVGTWVMVDGASTFKVLPEHELALVLRRFGPTHSRRMSLRLIAQYMVTVGEAYLLKVGADGGRTRELHMMQPAKTYTTFSNGVVSGYVAMTGNGARVPLRVEDVVHVWLPDPETLFTAEGYLGPQALSVDSEKFATETVRAHFESNATPSVVLELDKDAALPSIESRATFDETWRQAYSRRLGGSRGLPAMLPPGFVAKVLAGTLGPEVLPFIEHWRDQILAAIGVPKSILGLTDQVGLGRATAEVNQYVMDLHTVTPLVDALSDALTEQLARPEYGDQISVRVKPFVSSDKDFELRREAQDLAGKVRSINEVRRERGVKDAPWGDDPVGSFTDAPYTGEVPAPLSPDNPAALAHGRDPVLWGTGREAIGAGPRHSPRATSPIDLEWQRVVQRERAFEPKFRAQYIAVLRAQERAVLEEINVVMARSQRAPTLAEIIAAVTNALAPSRWATLFVARTEPVRKASVKSSGQDAITSVGVKKPFVFTPTVVEVLDAQAKVFREQVSRTTVKRATSRIIDAMKESVAAGESLSERTKRIRDAIGQGFEVRRNEARTIARTEMLKATQKAQTLGYIQSEVVEGKQWNTSRDDAVRDAHQIDGQVVGLADDFTLADGATGSEPGADTLPVEDVVNCRCFMTPILEGA